MLETDKDKIHPFGRRFRNRPNWLHLASDTTKLAYQNVTILIGLMNYSSS